jgi:hypothetical protein
MAFKQLNRNIFMLKFVKVFELLSIFYSYYLKYRICLEDASI